jgi:hypothetical protein
MHRIQQCLDRITQVRVAAHDLNSAYLLRTRTHRMLLTVQKMVASEYGAEILRPTVLQANRNSDPKLRKAAEITNELLQSTQHLSQRSAAFDRRWQQEWHEVESVLIQLESCLRDILLQAGG